MTAFIEAAGLVKRFGRVSALTGLDLHVEEGTVSGLLGPNGAGKTTAVRVLGTLVAPDAGTATVGGYDIVRQSGQVRQLLGLSGQYAAVDAHLTGRENLELFAQLHRYRKRAAVRRADELIDRFDLGGFVNRLTRTYSGGMRRRLDLAVCLIARPKLIALDEPTTGLDPRSRYTLWETIDELVGQGTTVLLTTQYLEEADRLADQIVVIDGGRAIATGTSDELKADVIGERLQVVAADNDSLPAIEALLERIAGTTATVDPQLRSVVVPVSDGRTLLAEVTRQLVEYDIVVHELGLRRATLDDVFFALTGHRTDATVDESGDGEALAASAGTDSRGGEQV
ncbi:ABC-2 type transport system ATP-binding protein [Tamaricihabitans halophyticus]|uniref:ABC-2 type transport system ATP-binding protein n=1 Tax=Tamaricihabitans halophyticus TaxID=1262583 RepID=A0A4R2R4R2_9PSEU|nr:ATP-binding cassette domain-containing protein [Tamaricihabitans halophyticus]TCP56769.1 ABC-2 type transport system ATP-binding protein [Tamaricihabitans halophyticus]